MYKIMVVEDDPNISEIICENIEKQGFQCLRIVEFKKIIDEFITFKPELILMDINLPGNDGFCWCEKIREISKAPIIFVSARDSETDIVLGTNMGGDDYLIKPFSIEVLLAKVKGMLRRTYSYNEVDSNILSFGELIFNADNGMISRRNIRDELTHNEMGILKILLKNQGKIVSRERIMRTLWSDEKFIDDNTLTVNITRLRKKLNDIGCKNMIKTIRNEGYII
ncbi:response regulator transcription factor [Clostridium felsineum]|uniref:Stage 0 sporulation protein A homolog n=1 Tax=Clostridium felsineum TaxID=36839 RepID=A0A1S8KXZ2_9CLOT|nr:response regulator transcription factor [Clostridium felsineum]MCR3757978.1 response regulator transcription factor [Clostridium felsineum]URZ03509.1 Response regulator protein GraR [Clostridium felsineum]URZ08176.1 Response regulator protein GraR [Clostridium felsineum]URZ13207.1 Response regulator protein GraR [Clostridium felsineum]URZ14812.1 Response regulator protein GraR [Clostridium felsineum DSM 794]